MEQRTEKQNRSMHKLFTMMATEFNTLGLDMRVILKPEWQIWWTPESVKENLWKPIMEAMYHKKSTTELDTAQVSKVYEQIMKVIGEKHCVSIPFPSKEELDEFYKTLQ